MGYGHWIFHVFHGSGLIRFSDKRIFGFQKNWITVFNFGTDQLDLDYWIALTTQRCVECGQPKIIFDTFSTMCMIILNFAK